MLGSAHIIWADARRLPLGANTVDLVVTSPPYLNLRAYQDAGQAYAGQVGGEASRAEFIDSLIDVTAECVRVLKPSGSMFVNLGDSYRDKSLQLTPHRYAVRCVDELGLLLRAEIIWSKPNGLPESVTDRVRRSHEVWWHFTLSPRYYSAVDEIREAHAETGLARFSRHYSERVDRSLVGSDGRNGEAVAPNPLGKLPGSVWTIPTEPLQVPDHVGVDHFAAFPTEWPRRIIAGWSPAGVCTACGEGRRPVSTTEWAPTAKHPQPGGRQFNPSSGNVGVLGVPRSTTITGYACACHTPDAPTTPAVVLDPFGGTGTTALVAKALGRTGISVDLSGDYSRLAQWRTNDPDSLAKASRVEKPPKQVDGQIGFDFEGVA